MHPTYRRFLHATALVLAIYCASIGTTSAERPADPLSLLGLRATVGAAPGYVPDEGCRNCHLDKYQSYQHVGMAQSFKRPGEAVAIEDFGREFFHQPSQRHYQIRRRGDEWIFRRHQLDAEGKPINVFETRIDWVLGSGNRARSYLYQTPIGELYELPLGWYSESQRWGMSPGYEDANHPGVRREVKRQCLFCHNAFPETPAGSDRIWQEDNFPHDLPQGTGCQRCHGPGAAHIRAVLTGADLEEIHDRIVNPRRLPPERRDSVCFQCHMLPAVSIFGSRRFGRPIYSFRPGELLSDYLVHVDIEEESVSRVERFEINHHGYRFWQSACYRQSRGELACISCHDPHVKPESRAFRNQVAGVCRGCHQGWAEQHPESASVSESSCVGCHMPTRRTRDVVEVTMTDHRIARGPFDRDALVRPLARKEPIITDIELLPFGQPPGGVEEEIYRIVAVLGAFPDLGAISALKNILNRSPHSSASPYMELLRAQLRSRDFEGAGKTAALAIERLPDQFRARTWMGLAQLGQDENLKAMEWLKQSIALQPTAEAHYNLASAAQRLKRFAAAEEAVNAAIALRPNMHVAWRLKGQIHAQQRDLEPAQAALLRALEIEPGDGPIYADLVRVLRRAGENEKADRFLAVGLRVALDPSQLEALKTHQ